LYPSSYTPLPLGQGESPTPPVEYRDLAEPECRVGGDGSAWCLRAGRWLRLKGVPARGGRLQVKINGRRHYLHRLVLLGFRGPCPPGMQGRHLDDNPTNNRVENLLWGTPLENAADKIRNGGQVRGETHGRSKLTEAQVRRIRLLALEGEALVRIAERFEVADTTVSDIVHFRKWRHLLAAEETPNA
jgi:hypothetical protein